MDLVRDGLNRRSGRRPATGSISEEDRTQEHARLVCEGLRAHRLPDAHVRAAARGLDAPALPSALFVYGTLRAGEVRAPMLARHARGAGTPARVEGALLDLGPYPGLVRGTGHVHGELVELTDPEDAFVELDEEEGFLGYGVTGSLYRRVIVDAETSRGARVHAWAYLYVGAAAGAPIASGDWRAR